MLVVQFGGDLHQGCFLGNRPLLLGKIRRLIVGIGVLVAQVETKIGLLRSCVAGLGPFASFRAAVGVAETRYLTRIQKIRKTLLRIGHRGFCDFGLRLFLHELTWRFCVFRRASVGSVGFGKNGDLRPLGALNFTIVDGIEHKPTDGRFGVMNKRAEDQGARQLGIAGVR